MPPSALDHLTRLNVFYPMLFKLTNRKMNRITHCGVLEFVADEGKVYLPYWVSYQSQAAGLSMLYLPRIEIIFLKVKILMNLRGF